MSVGPWATLQRIHASNRTGPSSDSERARPRPADTNTAPFNWPVTCYILDLIFYSSELCNTGMWTWEFDFGITFGGFLVMCTRSDNWSPSGLGDVVFPSGFRDTVFPSGLRATAWSRERYDNRIVSEWLFELRNDTMRQQSVHSEKRELGICFKETIRNYT